ncbi:MAG: amino acid adenylation domain-containing protein [Jatrophihabitantaceae bacterium]
MRYPVSFAQQRLWFLDQLMPGEPTFNMPYAIWLDGPLDADALQRAMDAMAARHSVLRTAIVAIDGLPEQVVADVGTVPIERISLRSPDGADDRSPDGENDRSPDGDDDRSPDGENDRLGDGDDDPVRQAEALALDRAVQPFELARAPLLRASLIDIGGGRRLLVLVLHHIISDAASMRILVEELSAAYRAETTGEPLALPPHWMQYGDFAVWQRDRLRGEELERQLSYWRQQLRGAPTLLTLPTDRPRPARQSSRGAVATATVPAAVTRRLAELAAGVNATMFMTFLAGFAVVLSRYARQPDLVIGTPVSGRTHVELEPVIGLFTNTVGLRVSLAGDPSFRQLLAQIRDTTVEAVSHQELPFEKLVEEFAPDRSLAYAPLTQVQFGHQSLTPTEPELPGISSRSRTMFTRTTKLDLSLFADTGPDSVSTLVAEYSTDLFDRSWAERFLGSVRRVLEQAAATPDTPVAELPMQSPAETAALIERGSHRPAPHSGPSDGESSDGGPSDGGPSDVAPTDVRRLLAASPSRVSDGTGSASMAEVCERAARLARLLAEHGVTPETPVGLCLERGIDMLVGLLAVWWAGGAYVPLDPDFPPRRLAAMAQGAGLRLVLSDRTHRELAASVTDGGVLPSEQRGHEVPSSGANPAMSASSGTILCVDDPAAAAAEPLPPVPLPPTALAYLIFTSGSTGQPKGVGIEHRSVANLLASFGRALDLAAGDRFVAVTTLSFDIAVLELLLPPVRGADLIIATGAQTHEPDRLRALIERTGATAMQATPQTWRLLLSAGGVPAGLRLRLCGGEALPRELADQLAAPGSVLWNLYGPTETTVWSAAGVVAGGPIEIGPPIEHTRVYLLDDRLAPVPVGVVGEVWLAGAGLARGYHDRPWLTAQSFRPDPWSEQRGARMYRTGDLGRWSAGSGLQLLGRTDHQVKLRGFRIECGEIEAVLRAHREVRQAAVVTALRGSEPALVAYVVPRRGGAAAEPTTDLLELLRPHLRAALPEYMVPDLVVALPMLPTTPNGKVDRAALPAPDWDSRRLPAGEHVEPRNPVEATLAGIWAELLATGIPIGVRDNLFAVGGHSLTATRFVARVADTYGVQLPVHQIFATPTIGELAEIVAADPGFSQPGEARHAELDSLSDADLDELLRAALAQRNRRRAIQGEPDL